MISGWTPNDLPTNHITFDLRLVQDIFPCTRPKETRSLMRYTNPFAFLRDGYDTVTSQLRPLSYPVLNEWPGRQMNEPFF